MDTLFQFGAKYVGIKEVPGPGSNNVILEWIQDYFPAAVDDSKVPWCSLFLLFLAQTFGFDITGATPMARSWLRIGEIVPLEEATENDIVVFYRGKRDSKLGHVGVFLCLNELGNPVVLSGNDSDQVTVRPFARSRVLGVVRLPVTHAAIANHDSETFEDEEKDDGWY